MGFNDWTVFMHQVIQLQGANFVAVTQASACAENHRAYAHSLKAHGIAREPHTPCVRDVV